jgi:hypothetical protein
MARDMAPLHRNAQAAGSTLSAFALVANRIGRFVVSEIPLAESANAGDGGAALIQGRKAAIFGAAIVPAIFRAPWIFDSRGGGLRKCRDASDCAGGNEKSCSAFDHDYSPGRKQVPLEVVTRMQPF